MSRSSVGLAAPVGRPARDRAQLRALALEDVDDRVHLAGGIERHDDGARLRLRSEYHTEFFTGPLQPANGSSSSSVTSTVVPRNVAGRVPTGCADARGVVRGRRRHRRRGLRPRTPAEAQAGGEEAEAVRSGRHAGKNAQRSGGLRGCPRRVSALRRACASPRAARASLHAGALSAAQTARAFRPSWSCSSPSDRRGSCYRELLDALQAVGDGVAVGEPRRRRRPACSRRCPGRSRACRVARGPSGCLARAAVRAWSPPRAPASAGRHHRQAREQPPRARLQRVEVGGAGLREPQREVGLAQRARQLARSALDRGEADRAVPAQPPRGALRELRRGRSGVRRRGLRDQRVDAPVARVDRARGESCRIAATARCVVPRSGAAASATPP